MKNLLLSLGHSSSAILVDDNELCWGYETERVSGLKSDSRFPAQVLERHLWGRIDMLYVTHWAPTGRLSDMSEKHWRSEGFSGVPIRTLSSDFTHHDAHLWGAMCYAGSHFPYGPHTIALVVDGFGILGEHFSVYRIDHYRKPVLLKRYRGYGTSLGLWYQYATAFMGMKMHEDEYKLLGYEAHVRSEDAKELDVRAAVASAKWMEWMNQTVYGTEFDPLFNLAALEEVKNLVFAHLSGVCKDFNIEDSSSRDGRTILAYYVQKVLENVVLGVLGQFSYQNLLLSGGVFYNVKLNKILLDRVVERSGKICVYPLAGDQGCALGLYSYDHPGFEFPVDLNWGLRRLYDAGEVKNLHVVRDHHDAIDLCDYHLRKYGVVNLVRGAMEFGPRALCNTSTLALPTAEMVAKINSANDRNTIMPMAPVMMDHTYHKLFESANNVHRSERHMIVAMELAEHPLDSMAGITHRYEYPTRRHTCRPQVMPADAVMGRLLGMYGGVLINTSFNFHGRPIALDMPSIIDNHMAQVDRDNDFHTVVIQNV